MSFIAWLIRIVPALDSNLVGIVWLLGAGAFLLRTSMPAWMRYILAGWHTLIGLTYLMYSYFPIDIVDRQYTSRFMLILYVASEIILITQFFIVGRIQKKSGIISR